MAEFGLGLSSRLAAARASGGHAGAGDSRVLRVAVLWFVAVVAALIALAGCGGGVGDGAQSSRPETSPSGRAHPGRQLFADNCGSCHILAAADTEGTIGRNLDERRFGTGEVLEAIEKGGFGTGKMPAGLVSRADAERVAEFVAEFGRGR